MKKIILLLAMTLCTSSIFAQVDVITKHNGEIVNGKVVRVDEYVVVYKYDGPKLYKVCNNLKEFLVT